jgi:hypothetical protein
VTRCVRWLAVWGAAFAAGGISLAQPPAAKPAVVVPVLFQDPPPAVSAHPPAAIVPAVPIEPPAATPEERPLKGAWKDGPYFATEDGLFTFRPSGRVQFDAAWYAMPATVRAGLPGPGPLEDGVAFRRARLNAIEDH